MRNQIIAGMLGALAFVACALVLKIGFLAAVGAGALVYLGVWLVLGGTPSALDAELLAEGLTHAEAMQAIHKARQEVGTLRKLGARLGDAALAAKVESICGVGDSILTQLKAEPRGIKDARRFLEYYLGTATTVAQRYAELHTRGADSEEVRKLASRFAELLDAIQATFERQRDRLLRHEALDLDTEITVLRQMMDMEGM